MSGLIRGLMHVFKLLFFWGISLLGLAILLNPTPIPGTDRSTSIIIAILLIAVGGALAKMFTAENWERRRARIWKKEMQR